MRDSLAQCAHRFGLTLLLVFATAAIVPRIATSAADTHLRIEVPAKGAAVPMLDIGGRPVVEVKINGKGPFPFILDTGATDTVIDSDLNEELSLGDTIKELAIGAIKVTDLEVNDG